MSSAMNAVVLDASVAVDLLAGTDCAPAAIDHLTRTELHAPAHLDAEVISALDRMRRAGDLAVTDVELALDRLMAMPVARHPLPDLLTGRGHGARTCGCSTRFTSRWPTTSDFGC
ncbi:type II toxin-antitoxin system VapC family toxin [Bounagaea algeriensis]